MSNNNPPSDSSSRFAAAFGATDLMQNPEFNTPPEMDDEFSNVVRAEDSVVDDQSSQSEDTPPDSSELSQESKSEQATSDSSKQKIPAEDRELITVTDETGKKRKVEINYADRTAIKKAYSEAAGMRKFQAERDQAITSKKQLESEFQKLKDDWQKLDSAFSQGKEHLFDLLEGKQGAFAEWKKSIVERELFLRDASPQEIEALKKKEAEALRDKEIAQIRKENEEFRQKMTEKEAAAEVQRLESQVHPVFSKYRFADKLGDEMDEQMFDEFLWNTTLKRLEPYEEKGLLTPELIEKEFKSVAMTIQKRIGVQAEKKVAKVVEQKKQEATENVQAKAMSNYSGNSNSRKARDVVRNMDTGDIFKNWSSIGKLFSNK